MESRWADLDGPVHYLDFGGRGRPLVLVHGLGGMVFNWLSIGPTLARDHRVLALDLRGFGRTPAFGHRATVGNQRALVDRFLSEVVGEPAVLVANSMGGLISVLEAAANPQRVAALVLVDPALPGASFQLPDSEVTGLFLLLLSPLALPALRHRTRRLGAEGIVRSVVAVTMADPGRADPRLLDVHVRETAERLHDPHLDAALVDAARSLLSHLFRGGLGPVYDSVRCPVLVVHGEHDRLVPASNSVEIGRRQGWSVAVLDGIGHVPMIEDPDRLLGVMVPWLASTLAEAV